MRHSKADPGFVVVADQTQPVYTDGNGRVESTGAIAFEGRHGAGRTPNVLAVCDFDVVGSDGVVADQTEPVLADGYRVNSPTSSEASTVVNVALVQARSSQWATFNVSLVSSR